MLLQGCGLLGWHLAMAFVGMSCIPGPGLSNSQRVSAERDVPSTSWGAMVPAWAQPCAQGSVSAMWTLEQPSPAGRKFGITGLVLAPGHSLGVL